VVVGGVVVDFALVDGSEMPTRAGNCILMMLPEKLLKISIQISASLSGFAAHLLDCFLSGLGCSRNGWMDKFSETGSLSIETDLTLASFYRIRVLHNQK
jgi:hypothetical protein